MTHSMMDWDWRRIRNGMVLHAFPHGAGALARIMRSACRKYDTSSVQPPATSDRDRLLCPDCKKAIESSHIPA